MLTLSMPEPSTLAVASGAAGAGAAGAAALSASGFDGAEHAASKLALRTTATQAFIGASSSRNNRRTPTLAAGARRASAISTGLGRSEAPAWRALACGLHQVPAVEQLFDL